MELNGSSDRCGLIQTHIENNWLMVQYTGIKSVYIRDYLIISSEDDEIKSVAWFVCVTMDRLTEVIWVQ